MEGRIESGRKRGWGVIGEYGFPKRCNSSFFMKLRDVFKSEDQTVWGFLCSQTTVREGAEVSHGGLLRVTRGTEGALPLGWKSF